MGMLYRTTLLNPATAHGPQRIIANLSARPSRIRPNLFSGD